MLITLEDLADHGVTVEPADQPRALRLIESASTAITDAAGSPIIERESTIVILGGNERILDLPGLPIREVHEVHVDGILLLPAEYRVAGAGLYRPGGWARGRLIPEITVRYTHGLPTVPADIVSLAAAMVGAGLNEANDGGWELQNGRLSSIGIDDYREGYATTGESVEQVTPMSLPKRTREWLAGRFGAGARVLRTL